MLYLPLASVSFGWKLFAVLWALLAVALIMIVLIQKGRGGGLGAAFGGGGANSLLGTKTGDFLTWVTICLVSLFLLGAVVMGKFMRPRETTLAPAATPQTQSQMPAVPSADDVADEILSTQEQVDQTAGQAAELLPEQPEEPSAPQQD
ncbi:MAG TPA: preprotein translocase subunit SecG [Phycisphaerales bacterium]|nr:preprotein translocase subunit SecG [Phycisphaerales bacterium]